MIHERSEVTPDAITDYVRRYDHVTFVELQRHFGDEASGTQALYLEGNILLWEGMSDAFADGLNECLTKETIHPHGSSWLVYMIDGGMPTAPIAKRPPKKGYKEEHWMPLVFRAGADCSAKECPRKKLSFS